MKTCKVVLFQVVLLVFSGLCLCTAKADMASVAGDGPEAIRGELPAGWRQMAAEEILFFERNGAEFSLQGKFVTGFRPQAGNALANGPFILIFEVKSENPVQQEQIQKIYSWFEKGRDLVTEALPAAIDNMTIENIEYLPERATILFQSAIEMDGDDFVCINSIILMRNGYLNIIGLAGKDADSHIEDISVFMRSVQVPESKRLNPRYEHEDAISKWLKANWQRTLGFLILFSVFAIAFRRRL